MTVSISYWTCTCGAHNTDGRSYCRECSAPRQTRAKAPCAQNDSRPGKDTGSAHERPAESVKRLTKAESRALAKARRLYPDATIICQGVTLPLHPLPGRSLSYYRVDMAIINPWTGPDRYGLGVLILVEVKGGYKGPGWEQGLERYMRARAEYPALLFELWDMS